MDSLEPETRLYLNKKIAYTALMLQEYAYREILDSTLIRENDRYMVKRKLNYVQNQINKINKTSKASRKEIESGEDIVLDNISLMASIAASCSIMPISQVDFIEEQFTKICVQALDNDKKLQQGQSLPIDSVSHMLTVKEVLDILDDSDHLDDAKTLIREIMNQ